MPLIWPKIKPKKLDKRSAFSQKNIFTIDSHALNDRMESNDDDYYYDSFLNYKETTNDPGPWMLIGVVSYSACCVLLLPILVRVSKSRQRKRSFLRNVQGFSSNDGEIEIVAMERNIGTRQNASTSVKPAQEKNHEINDVISIPTDEISHVSTLVVTITFRLM